MTNAAGSHVHGFEDARSALSPLGTPFERVTAWLENSEHDVLILTGSAWVRWLTGYSRYGAGLSAVLVQADGSAKLFVPSYELRFARECVDESRVTLRGYTDVGYGLLHDPFGPLMEALRLIPRLSDARVAHVESEWLGESGLLMAPPLDVSAAVAKLRMVKSAVELDEVARRVAMCWVAQHAVSQALSWGASEIELYSLARASAEGHWGSPIEMNADVIGGPSCAGVGAPVSVPGRRVVQVGETLIVDLVMGVSGYFADITWTHIRGENLEQAALRDSMVTVMETIARGLVPGRRCSDVYREMDHLIHDAAPNDTFTHHGGHGIGLSGYEAPFLAPFDDTELEEGMTLALEPGAYGRGHGVRVENNYVVTKHGGVEIPGRPLDRGLLG
ncbi:MAG TPA: M24 family metallopeptidase [Acidimicrobiales bacterium]|jgi:Xaa-Pro aminopeptidase|nr:M24 family metallopeptidase [Acidimicrobiales bacterium]